MSFFANKNALELANRTMLEQPDLYAAKVVGEDASSLYDATAPTAATFVLDSGIIVADDDLNSTALNNLYFLDDNNALGKVVIDDTVLSTNLVTFDSTAAVLVSDETTAPTLTDTNSFQTRVLQPSSLTVTHGSSTIPVGLFLGDTSDLNFNYTINEAKLKVGIPKKLRAKGVVEVEAMLEFNLAQITDPNILGAGFRGATRGLQTNQTQYHFGFQPAEAGQYMIQAVANDKSGRNFFTEFFLTELLVASFSVGGDEFKQLGMQAELLSDTFRPDASDMFRSISLD